jgi:hypothetical protein
MPTLTEAAARSLDERLGAAQAEEGTAVRLEHRYGDLWTMRLDRKAPGDTVFNYGGRTVLLMDRGVAETLANTIVDCGPTATGGGLILYFNDRVN